MNLKLLVGSGEKIGLFVLPFLVIALVLNFFYPSLFYIGQPSSLLILISIFFLTVGIVIWLWSVVLILTHVPQKKLITTGPYSLVKHPLYTGVALFVLPWLGFLFNTWLGVFLGIILYLGSRFFSPEEEKQLASLFGTSYAEYLDHIKFPWL